MLHHSQCACQDLKKMPDDDGAQQPFKILISVVSCDLSIQDQQASALAAFRVSSSRQGVEGETLFPVPLGLQRTTTLGLLRSTFWIILI